MFFSAVKLLVGLVRMPVVIFLPFFFGQGSDREEDLVTAKSTVFGNQALLDTHRRLRLPQVTKYLQQVPKKRMLLHV